MPESLEETTLIEQVEAAFRGDEDPIYGEEFGLSPERAKEETLSFLYTHNADLGCKPIEHHDRDMIVELAKKLMRYEA